jgi:hypothetical protein
LGLTSKLDFRKERKHDGGQFSHRVDRGDLESGGGMHNHLAWLH